MFAQQRSACLLPTGSSVVPVDCCTGLRRAAALGGGQTGKREQVRASSQPQPHTVNTRGYTRGCTTPPLTCPGR